MAQNTPKRSINLADFLPLHLRNSANESILKNLFNKFFTKNTAIQQIGYIGKDFGNFTDTYIGQPNLDRELNSLQPGMHARHGTDDYVFTLNDAIHKLKLLGVDVDKFDTWGKALGFNLYLPIDLDKFCNYSSYYWVGQLDGSMPKNYNPKNLPEYIIMHKDANNDWSDDNRWMHIDDFEATSSFGLGEAIQARRPIIEYSAGLELNSSIDATGTPTTPDAADAVIYTQSKTARNQYPLFNLYEYDGTHAGKIGTLIRYVEGSEFEEDEVLGFRISKDLYGDYTFEQGVSDDSGRLYFYKDLTGIHTLWRKGLVVSPRYVTKNEDDSWTDINPATDINKIGTWLTPDQMVKNINHENRHHINYGDLSNHFVSIISAQQGFTGNPYGSNNTRFNTDFNPGLGGIIKDYNTDFGLFLGVLNQPESSPISMIDFLADQYNQTVTFIKEFVNQNIGELVTVGKFDPRAAVLAQAYSKLQAEIKDALRSRSADNIFIDSTSAIAGFPVTLPYMGLIGKVKPTIIFDYMTGNNMVVHHDGHITPTDIVPVNILAGIANKAFLRSDGSTVGGIVGINPPGRPYRNQFWFNPATNSLQTYAVNTDDGNPKYPLANGDYVFNRQTGILKRFVAATNTFTPVNDSTVAWVSVDVSKIVVNALLNIETELHDNCPAITSDFSIDAIESANTIAFDDLMEKEFIKFASKFGLDPYITDYTPKDAFTWNYSGSDFDSDGSADDIARWYTVYGKYFGTVRPNLEPWKLAGFTDQPTWWNGKYADTTGTRLWSDIMWSDINGSTTPTNLPVGVIWSVWIDKLGVNTSTDALLPPYVSIDDPLSVHALTTDIPPNIDARYVFGDNGPIELQWKFSTIFEHDRLKTAFRLDPINFVTRTWGNNNVVTDDYEINRGVSKKISHNEIVLHGEAFTSLGSITGIESFSIVYSDDVFNKYNPIDLPPQIFTVRVIANTPTGHILGVSGSVSGNLAHAYTGIDYSHRGMTFRVDDNSYDMNIGDKWVIDNSVIDIYDIKFVSMPYSSFIGFNQVYVQLNRHNNVDASIALGTTILRDWTAKLIYRASGMLDTNTLSINTDDYAIHKDDTSVILKENHGIKDYWLDAIRIQLIRSGDSITSERYHQRTDAGTFKVPRNLGADWEYRIEIYNKDNPTLSYYDMSGSTRYHTFNAISGDHSIDEWKAPLDKGTLITRVAPFTVVGIQNVVDIMFGYIEKLKEDGWRFNKSTTPDIDNETGRAVNWQLEIERFISEQYKGIIPGKAVLLNPFIKSVWFETPHGVVSSLEKRAFADAYSTQTVFNAMGKAINQNQIRVFRTDDETEIISQEPMAGIHLIIDEYEHVVVFENYVASKNERRQLMFDSFLGLHILRLYLQADIQEQFDGKITFGGHYLHNNNVRKNIESSLAVLTNMYDTSKMQEGHPATKSARGLLGYRHVPYLNDMGVPDKSQFSFWKAMIHNKGSNNSIQAFLNSARFKSAEIDEYWAYKIADYGDARTHNYPEIRLNVNDADDRWLKLEFTDGTPTPGFAAISNTDSSRWFSIDDLNSDMYFEADLVGTMVLDYSSFVPGKLINLMQGPHEIIADYVEVFLEKLGGGKVLSDDPIIEGPQFIIHNSTTIQLLAELPSAAHRYVVKCYGPAFDRYNPCKLIDYANDVVVQDVTLWDPRRGSHSPLAKSIIDIISNQEPAGYNFSTRTVNNKNYDPLRPWGKNEVGKVWWDTQNLAYIPYNDARIFDLNTRIAHWGALAAWASIDLYEWTESKVHPSKYDTLVLEQEGDAELRPEDRASGTPARKELYKRNRTWARRPIAWTKDGASLQSRAFPVEVLNGMALLTTTTWKDVGVTTGMKLSNFTSGLLDGEAIVTGPEVSYVTHDLLPWTTYFRDFTIESLDNGINITGTIRIEPIIVSGDTYLLGKVIEPTGHVYTQKVKISDPISFVGIQGALMTYEFSSLGFKISARTTSAWDTLDLSFTDVDTDAERIAIIANDFQVDALDNAMARSAVTIKINVDFSDTSFNTFVIWTDPAAQEFAEDLPAPNNLWTPIFGEYSQVSQLANHVKDIKAEISTPMTNTAGESVTRYKHVWGAWALIQSITKRVKNAIDGSNVDRLALLAANASASAKVAIADANTTKSSALTAASMLQRNNNAAAIAAAELATSLIFEASAITDRTQKGAIKNSAESTVIQALNDLDNFVTIYDAAAGAAAAAQTNYAAAQTYYMTEQPGYIAAQTNYATAQANYDYAKDEYDYSVASYNHAEDQIIAAKADYVAATATYRAAPATYDAAIVVYDAAVIAYDASITPAVPEGDPALKTVLDTAKAVVDASKAAVDASKATVDSTKAIYDAIVADITFADKAAAIIKRDQLKVTRDQLRVIRDAVKVTFDAAEVIRTADKAAAKAAVDAADTVYQESVAIAASAQSDVADANAAVDAAMTTAAVATSVFNQAVNAEAQAVSDRQTAENKNVAAATAVLYSINVKTRADAAAAAADATKVNLVDAADQVQKRTAAYFFTEEFRFTDIENIADANVYVNGMAIDKKSFEIIGSSVIIKNSTAATFKLGDSIDVIIPVPVIAKDKLSFDPVISDDPSILIQYKYDYQYTVHETYNEFGQEQDKKYFFWVSGKNIATRGRQISLSSAKEQLQHINRPYGTMDNILPATDAEPVRYTQYIGTGLSRYIKKDDTYKLRFTRDFTLREDPHGMNLKNVHTEWVLLRESQRTKIPKELWERVIDAACGQDIVGNQIPSDARINYDSIYGTSTKYGFENGQALVDKALAIESITYTILNTTVSSRNFVIDPGNLARRIDFLDYSKVDEWFLTSESARKTLTEIWDKALPEQVNEIFFSLFYSALAENYEFKNIIKTSMIAAHTIRFFDAR